MRSRKTTISAILLASLIGFQMLGMNVRSIRSTTDISVINPATGNNQFIFYTNTTSVGFRFNATLWVSGYGSPPVYAWQVRLSCNFTFLNITRAWTAVGDPAYIFAGRTSLPQAAIGVNTVLVGDSLLGNVAGATPPPEPAKLATIEFEITSAPITQNLFLSLDINNADTYLLDTSLAEIPYVTKASGEYEYINPNLPTKIPSTITINVNPTSVFTGDNVTISGTIAPTRPNAQVTIYANPIGYNLSTLANVETDSASDYVYVWKPMNAGIFQIRSSWTGDQNTWGASSPSVILTVSSLGPPPPPQFPTVSVVNPQTGDNLFISDMGQFYLGYRFNATVWVYNITDLLAYQVHLTVNDALLNITRAWIPSSSQWVFYGKTTISPGPFFYDVNRDGSNEAVELGSTIIQSESPTFNGTGLLAVIEFQVIRLPAKYETLTCNLDIDNPDTLLIDSNVNTINVTKKDGFYEVMWPAPSVPETTITVINPLTSDSQFTFYANTTHVGDRFNATIWVNAATNVSSWQVRMNYKPDLLNATLAWIPSTDPQYIFYGKASFAPNASIASGSVMIGAVTMPAVGVDFTTPKILVIIEFQILQAPLEKETVFSNLAINNVDTCLLDPQPAEISASKMNGYYQYVGAGGTPSAPTEVMVVPPQLTVGNPNATLPTPPFSLNIFVSNVIGLYAWQVKIYYNPATLNFTSAAIPLGHVFEGKDFLATSVVVRADEFGTYIMLGATLLGNQTGFNGSGVLCQLTFIGTVAGNSPLIFSSPQNETTLLNPNLETIPFDVFDGLVTVLGAPPPPPPPPKNPSKISLDASPTTVIVGQNVLLSGYLSPFRPYTNVMIFASPANGTWLLLSTVQIDQNGQYSCTWTPSAPGWFELKSTWAGDESTLPAESPIQVVQVEPRPAHELIANLTAPDYTLPDATTALNASVYNFGTSTETNVQLQLFIQGTLVASQTVPALMSTGTYTLPYLWKPQTEGTFNITAYVPSVPGEYNVTNNRVTIFVTVARPLIHPSEGQWAEYNITAIYPPRNITNVMIATLTYTKYISPALINVTITTSEITPPGANSSGWMILNIVTRQVEEDSGIYWAGMWFPGWIQTNVTVGSMIRLLTFNATVSGSQLLEAAGREVECWRLDFSFQQYGSAINYTFLYDKTTGLWIAMEVKGVSFAPITENLILVATNIPIGSALKVQTDKAMYVRNETAAIQVTYKIGDTPVENADVLVEVDYPDGTPWFTWTMTTDANGYAATSFVTPDFPAPYGTYEVHATAYKTGMPVASATTTFRLVHYQADLTLWFEGPDLALINQNATITMHIKNVGNLTAQNVRADFFVPADGNLQVFAAPATNYVGIIDPGQEVTLMATVTAIQPYRYSFHAMAKYTWDGSIMMSVVQAYKTLIYTYHVDYPVDLLNMTVSVTNGTITVNLTVVNYGDSPVEVTLIASAQQTTTKLMLGSVYQKITINPGQTATVSLTIATPTPPAQGEYEVQGILATGLPHEGGFTLTHLEQKTTL